MLFVFVRFRRKCNEEVARKLASHREGGGANQMAPFGAAIYRQILTLIFHVLMGLLFPLRKSSSVMSSSFSKKYIMYTVNGVGGNL